MRILLTGGSGFIGKYLRKHLEHEILAPSSSELNLTNEDQVRLYLENNPVDVVIHSAVFGREQVCSTDQEITNINLLMFKNLYSCLDLYDKFINIGSGAEFGLTLSSDNSKEEDIFLQFPTEAYGLGKNIIARIISHTNNFYNLRLFSCIDPSEPDGRLLKKFLKSVREGIPFVVDKDRYVDFFSLHDLTVVINALLDNQITIKDLNLVYQHKYLVSSMLYKYCEHHNIDKSAVNVTGTSNINYTGDGSKLLSLNLQLRGLDEELKLYKVYDE
jgi:GDP-L-fucose synthase